MTKRKWSKAARAVLSVFLLLTMLAQLSIPVFAYASGGTYSTGKSSVKYGDVNDDGLVNTVDVDLLARYLAMDTSVTINLAAADVDASGAVDLADLLNLVKYVKGDANVNLGQTVTVTFDTNGGKEIAPVTVVVGSTITAPKPEKDNSVFLGWFTDEALTVPFYNSDPITEDVTVYAKYAEVNGEPEYTPSAFALTDQSAGLIFTVERHISSLAQLSSEHDGHLLIIKAEAMSDQFSNGESSIGELFDYIFARINDETAEGIFLSKLSAFGFDSSDESFMSKFDVKSMSAYKVSMGFPRLTERDIARPEICDVSYSLIINSLNDYMEDLA